MKSEFLQESSRSNEKWVQKTFEPEREYAFVNRFHENLKGVRSES